MPKVSACSLNAPAISSISRSRRRHCHRDRQRARPRRNVHPPPARPPQAAQEGIRKIPLEVRDNAPRVVDGDTLDMAGQRVRLQGIDAPESAQACRQATGQRYRCGDRATEALRVRIGAGAVTCTIEGRDGYNRALSTCYTADGTDLNAWLVRQGHRVSVGYSVGPQREEAAMKRRLALDKHSTTFSTIPITGSINDSA